MSPIIIVLEIIVNPPRRDVGQILEVVNYCNKYSSNWSENHTVYALHYVYVVANRWKQQSQYWWTFKKKTYSKAWQENDIVLRVQKNACIQCDANSIWNPAKMCQNGLYDGQPNLAKTEDEIINGYWIAYFVIFELEWNKERLWLPPL